MSESAVPSVFEGMLHPSDSENHDSAAVIATLENGVMRATVHTSAADVAKRIQEIRGANRFVEVLSGVDHRTATIVASDLNGAQPRIEDWNELKAWVRAEMFLSLEAIEEQEFRERMPYMSADELEDSLMRA